MKCTDSFPAELTALLPEALQSLAEPVALIKDKQLFAQGARPTALFYVVNGEVVLERAGMATAHTNHSGLSSNTSPSTSITTPLSSFSPRPARSVSLPLRSASTASVTISASSAI